MASTTISKGDGDDSFFTQFREWLAERFDSGYPDPEKNLAEWKEAGLSIPHCQRQLREKLRACTDNWRKRKIVCALGVLGDKEATPDLIELLRQEPADIQYQAISALIEIGDARAIAPLEACLSNENAHVRAHALEGLVALDKANARQYIERMRGDKDAHVRAAVAILDMKLKAGQSK